MDVTDLKPDEKRLLLKNFNHRLNNDLQEVLALIKLKKRFNIDKDEIINFSCVSIASMSSIQNLMYNTNHESDYISTSEFFDDFVKILNDYYSKSNIEFSNEIEDFYASPKKVFQLMLLVNEMVSLSLDFSFNEDLEKKISFNLEKIGEEGLLTYSDNGSGIKEIISGSDIRAVLFEQLIKQIDGTLESSDSDSVISVKFYYY
ncbi:sensor histidine kinase [uncultured Methanobrevibacter sp.]|uniref:histidine kinase dimerization/phosphoacceptor domain -containing protein n=1 Tax=uncultured Methanobrevibacter sp. TaxID=253161 RepID=UPI0025ECCCC7|nr:sensor histidine kinase [uncultured Methanobrevibacter sp.]